MNFFRFGLSIFVIIVPIFVGAQSNVENLDSLIERALQVNPKILSAERGYNAALEDIPVIAEVPDPVFMTEFRGIPLEIQNYSETREVMFMFQQMFPYPGKLSKVEEKAERMAEVQKFMVDAVKLDVKAAVKKVYYQIFQADKALEINLENQILMGQLLKITEVKYTVGKASQQDIFKAQTELSKLENESIELKYRRKTLVAQMNQLLNQPMDTPLLGTKISEDLPEIRLDIQFIIKDLVHHQPILSASQKQIDAGFVDVEIAKKEAKPDFTIMLGYNWMNDMPDALMGRFSINLPFAPWSNEDNKARINSSMVGKKQRELEYEVMYNQLAYQTAETIYQLQTIKEQVEIFRTQLIPEAKQIFEASLSSYQADLVDFVTVISNERIMQDYRLRYWNLVGQYYQNLAMLEKIMGKDLF